MKLPTRRRRYTGPIKRSSSVLEARCACARKSPGQSSVDRVVYVCFDAGSLLATNETNSLYAGD